MLPNSTGLNPPQDSSSSQVPPPPVSLPRSPQGDRICSTSKERCHVLAVQRAEHFFITVHAQCISFLLCVGSSWREGMFYTPFHPVQCPPQCPSAQISKHPSDTVILAILRDIMTNIHLVTCNNQLLINYYSSDCYNDN